MDERIISYFNDNIFYKRVLLKLTLQKNSLRIILTITIFIK